MTHILVMKTFLPTSVGYVGNPENNKSGIDGTEKEINLREKFLEFGTNIKDKFVHGVESFNQDFMTNRAGKFDVGVMGEALIGLLVIILLEAFLLPLALRTLDSQIIKKNLSGLVSADDKSVLSDNIGGITMATIVMTVLVYFVVVAFVAIKAMRN